MISMLSTGTVVWSTKRRMASCNFDSFLCAKILVCFSAVQCGVQVLSLFSTNGRMEGHKEHY